MKTSKQPWKIVDHGGPAIRWRVIADNNIPVLVTFGQINQLGDAKLAAAAPDLLVALIALHDAISGYFCEGEWKDAQLLQARAAIDKAKG